MKLKKLLSIIIMIIAILFITTKVEAATTQWKNYVAYKATTDLVVRSGPGTGYSKVTTIKNGYPISASDAVNGWRKINGKNQYVEASKTTKVAWKTYAAYQVTLTDGDLNVRIGPGSSYTASKKYHNGEVISVTEEIKGTDGTLWRKIRGKNELYVASSYLKKVSWGSATTYTIKQDIHAEYGPGDFYTDASTYKKGTMVRLTKAVKSPDGKYWRKVEGQELYICNSYVTAVQWKNYVAYKATADLVVRSGPGTGYSKVTTIKKGYPISASDAVNGWRKINGKNQYVEASKTTKVAWKTYAAYQVTLTDGDLNVRIGPGSSYTASKKYHNGEVISVTEEIKGTDGTLWRKIRGKNELYVASSYLKKVSWGSATTYTIKQDIHAEYGPGDFYTDASTYKKGTVVRLTKAVKSPDGKYWRKVEGQELYICNSNVTAMPWKNYKTYTVTSGVNARKGPGTNFEIITTYNTGVTLKASEPINGWSKIEGKEQYVSSNYLKLTSTSTSTTYKNYATYVVNISSGVLNVRDKASTLGNVVRELQNGETIRASEPVNGWSKIEGKEQYVSSSYLKLSSSSSSTSTTYKNYATYIVNISSGVLNVRDKASTSGNIVRELENGETIRASEEVNGWRKIEGKEQYVSASYTKLYSSSSTTSKNITLIKVYRSDNVVYCYNSEGTQIYKFQCTVGMSGHETPSGTFYIYGREENHWSEAYSAWMPYTSWIEGTNGCAFHVGSLYAQSHGCVHLSEEAAIIVYNQAKDGTKVIIY